MSRYRNGPVIDDWSAAHTAQEYIEQEADTWTGLYDHNGHRLHRQREPIGYNPNRWNTEMAKKSKPMKKSGKGKGC